MLAAPSSPSSSAWSLWLASSAAEAASLDQFSALSWIEMRSYMLNTLLRDTDAMSMSRSLEIRVPFLDWNLIETVFALPLAEKNLPGRPKALLAAALAGALPAEALSRPKRPFAFPFDRWLRGSLRSRVEEGLHHPAPPLAEFFAPRALASVWRAFLAGRTSWSRPWSLFVLNEWARRHLARPSA